MFERGAEQSPVARHRVPPLTTVLLGLNLGLFLATALAGGTEEPAVLALFGAKVTALVEEGEIWRVVSAAFLHIGPLHLVLNAYALYLLGGFVERAYGFRRMLGIYAAGAAGGGVVSTLLSPAMSAGASGAVLGLLGTTLWFAYRNRERLPQRSQRLFWTWLLPFFVASLLLSFLSEIIDNWAHLGGLGGGLLAAVPWGNPALRRMSRSGRAVATGVALAAGGLLVACLGFAVSSAARGALWAEARWRNLDDPALGLRLQLPAAWKEVSAEEGLRQSFVDRLGGGVRLQVRPFVSGAAETEALVQAELRGLTSSSPSAKLVRGPEPILLAARSATRLVVDESDERLTVRSEIYFVPGRGRAVILSLDAREPVVHLYRDAFERIGASLAVRDDSSLLEGWALLGAGDARAAARKLEVAASGPRPFLALRALGSALRRLGDTARSLEVALRASSLAPADPLARLDLIEALHAAGRGADAKRLFTEARALVSRDGRLLFALGQTVYQLGWESEAIEAFKEVVSLRRDLYAAHNALAWLLATAKDRSLRDPEGAVRLARVAVEGHRWQEPAFLDTLAEAQYVAGRPQEAVATQKKAVDLSPRDDYYRKQLEKFRMAAGLPAAVPGDGGR
jgi:membrane associated rhomboid family serine protease/Flp pilus assembly protein TadD